MKHILLIICCLTFFIYSNRCFASNTVTVIQTPFEPDLCQNGYAGSWTGACICYDREKNPNRYCNPDTQSTEIHPFVQAGNKTFTLSGGILNWDEATQFCTHLGQNFRLASRGDFNCQKTGIGCLNHEIFLPIKKQYGNRGFFWLDEADLNKAYYIDLNDGTVYNTKKSNQTTMQALCIKED